MPVLYLDLAPLSDLAAESASGGGKYQNLIEALTSHKWSLGVSFLHGVEAQAAASDVRSFISDFSAHCHVVWAPPVMQIKMQEVQCAQDRIDGKPVVPIKAFFSSIADCYHPELRYTPTGEPFQFHHLMYVAGLDMTHPCFQQFLLSMKAEAEVGASEGKQAFVVTAPRRSEVHQIAHVLGQTRTDSDSVIISHYRDEASKLLKAAGGIAAFPCVHAGILLARYRLLDTKRHPKSNDMIDEWHCQSGVYADLAVLDRGTVSRLRHGKYPRLRQMRARLAEAETLITEYGARS